MINDERVSRIINQILNYENIETAEQFVKFERFEREELGRYFDDSNIRSILLLTPVNLLEYVDKVKKITSYNEEQEKLIEKTQRKLEKWIALYEGNTFTECYEYLLQKKAELSAKFKEETKKDEKEEDLLLASAKIGGIAVRNLQRKNNNLDGEYEEYPYSDKQIRIIDKYVDINRALEIMDTYTEQNDLEDADEEEEK